MLPSVYFVRGKKKKLESAQIHIWNLITHYLHKHTELCLNNLGRFAAQSNEFVVDPVAKKIMPAQKRIYFQEGFFEHSPDFLSFSASILACSEIEIVHNLDKFVARFKQDLQLNKRIEIENLGVFKFNVMGEIVFESVQSDLFLDNTFGLKPIHFAANLLKTKRIVVETPEEEDAALVAMRESALKELKVLLDNARVAESNQVQKSSKVFPIVATVLTLILLINLALFLYKGPVDGLKQQISQMNIFGNAAAIIDSQQIAPAQPEIIEKQIEVDTASISQPVIEPTIEAPIEPKPELNLEPKVEVEETPKVSEGVLGVATIGQFMRKSDFEFDSTFYTIGMAETVVSNSVQTEITENKPLEAAAPIEPAKEEKNPTEVYDMPYMVNVDAQINEIDKGFYVIAGAFKVEANAQRFKEKLVKSGDTSAIVIKPSKYPYYLVSFEKNKNLNKALNLYEQKEKKQPSVWVYCAY